MSIKQEVIDKYGSNQVSGQEAVATGRVAEFAGYPKDHINGISVRAFLDRKTLAEIYERLLGPIKAAARACGVTLLTSDLWTRHLTVTDMRFLPSGMDAQNPDRERFFESVIGDENLVAAQQKLSGKQITFDFSWQGSAITLAATDIPNEVDEIRQITADLLSSLGMIHKDYSNIWHTTLARFGTVEGNGDYARFSTMLAEILGKLKTNPIIGTIDRVAVEGNVKFQETGERYLFLMMKIRQAMQT